MTIENGMTDLTGSLDFAPFELFAPAKLNLMLRVLGRRADGYHELQTLFDLLDWGDTLRFSSRHPPDSSAAQENTPPISIRGEFGQLAERDNLIWKAAQRLLPFAHRPVPVQLEVSKRIPAGGGLGGGSSNAATTLKALNRLWDCRRTDAQLAAIGTSLGADVPVFLGGQAALAAGIGEQLQPMKLPRRYYLLFLPPEGLSTATVFADDALPRNNCPLSREECLRPENWSNDCREVAIAHCPSLAKGWQRVQQALSAFPLKGVHGPHLSGTGSVFFLAFDRAETAQRFSRQCQVQGFPEYRLCASAVAKERR